MKIKKSAALIIFLIIIAIAAGCSTQTTPTLTFDANKVEVNIESVKKLPEGIAYQLKLSNNSMFDLKHVDVYLSYGIKDSTGGIKDNPFKVTAQPSGGLRELLKHGESVNLTVFAPVGEVFGNNDKLDFDNPFVEIRGFVIDGQKETIFMKGERK